MGQKVNPTGLRLGINRTWDSRWFADDNYADLLLADIEIRKFLTKKLAAAGISHIVIGFGKRYQLRVSRLWSIVACQNV